MGDETAMTWVVTGGASGIGAQLVAELRGAGETVIVWDRDKLDEPDFVQLDLTEPGGIEAAARRVTDPLHCFVHCAGNPSSTSIARDDAAERMRSAFELHVVAFVRAVRALARPLAAAKGSVVAVGSAAGEVVYPGTLAYGASKAALQRTVQQLAVELAPAGIRVNAVAPGAVATPMTAEYWADTERSASRLKYIPLGRQAQPDAVSSVIRFLASADADYMTGETVRVDGGSRLGMYNTAVRSVARFKELGD
jgi:3-oxoacyl-[acyl-carrier protein] reductase